MAEFLVVVVDPAARRIALADAFGRLHLARLTDAAPEPGIALHGCVARLGACLLAATGGVRVYPIVFEAVDCDAETMQRQLRREASPTARSRPQTAAGDD